MRHHLSSPFNASANLFAGEAVMFDDLGELRSMLASSPPSTELFEELAAHIDFFQPADTQQLRHLDYVAAIVRRWPPHIDRPVPEMAFIAGFSQGAEQEACSPFLTLCNTLRLDSIPATEEQSAVALCRHPHLSHVDRVRLIEPHPSTDLVKDVIPVLPASIRQIDLSNTHATEFFSHLLEVPLFDRIEVLDLEHANLQGATFEPWTRRMERHASSLKYLYLQGAENVLQEEHLLTWLRQDMLPSLEELDLRHHALSDAFYRELAHTTSLPRLKWVHVSPYLVSTSARTLLASSDTLPPSFTRYWRSRCH